MFQRMDALILVATLGGPTMFARIGVMRALNRHVEREFSADRKRPSLGKAEAGARPVTVEAEWRQIMAGLQRSG